MGDYDVRANVPRDNIGNLQLSCSYRHVVVGNRYFVSKLRLTLADYSNQCSSIAASGVNRGSCTRTTQGNSGSTDTQLPLDVEVTWAK